MDIPSVKTGQQLYIIIILVVCGGSALPDTAHHIIIATAAGTPFAVGPTSPTLPSCVATHR